MEWDGIGCAVRCDAMLCFFMYMNIYTYENEWRTMMMMMH